MTTLIPHVCGHMSEYKHKKHTQYCHSMWANETFFPVTLVKCIANKAQKSKFSYYRLQIGMRERSWDYVSLALGGERPDERPYHGFVFIKGEMYNVQGHPKHFIVT